MNFLVGLISVNLNLCCVALLVLLYSSGFDRALQKTLKHEGGYVHSLGDDAGPTNMGITIGTFRTYVKDPDASYTELKQLSKSDVREIYKDMFWDEYNVTQFPLGLQDLIFDMTVQHGHYGASKIIQRALNDLGGKFSLSGKITTDHINFIRSMPILTVRDAINVRRMLFIKSLTTRQPFRHMKRGLEARVRHYDTTGATKYLI